MASPLRKQTNHRAKWSLHSFNFLAKLWSRERIEFENPVRDPLSYPLWLLSRWRFLLFPKPWFVAIVHDCSRKIPFFFGIWKRKRVLAVALNQFILTFSSLDWIGAVFRPPGGSPIIDKWFTCSFLQTELGLFRKKSCTLTLIAWVENEATSCIKWWKMSNGVWSRSLPRFLSKRP